MLKCDDEVFLTKTVPVHKQSNSSDRGLFALAFAFDLANNLDPSIITYNEKILRKHLLPCIENEEITKFLKTNEWLARSKDKTLFETHEDFCSCRDVFLKMMLKGIQKLYCRVLQLWRMISSKMYKHSYKDVSWECNQCIR